MSCSTAQPVSTFQFERDTLGFANELVWLYRFDPVTGAMSVCRNQPPPTYSHRCFVLVRTVRQFLYHARFEPTAPIAAPDGYRRLIRGVVARDPRRASPPGARIVIPGYEGLRAFSRAQEGLLKAECGGAVQSYFLRSHWRMVLPVWRRHQEGIARQLQDAVRQGQTPAVHLFRFPRITINHGILLFGLTESATGLCFAGYDPNLPERPVSLTFDRAQRRFLFPPAAYWAGDPLSVIEVFRGGLY